MTQPDTTKTEASRRRGIRRTAWAVALVAVPGKILVFANTSTAFEPSSRVDARTGRVQGRLDVLQALLGLLDHLVRNLHRRVVEAGGAGDEHPVALHHGARVTDLLLEGGPGGDEAA